MDTQLDPQVVNLAKAIRQTESGGNFNARGKSGEYGAYQFTAPTWQKEAAALGINVPVDKATPQQQNQVAYTQLKRWKDAGYNPGQIASMWNAGETEPNAYQGTFSNGKPSVGINSHGVHYDVPAYAKSVASAYQTLKQGGQVNIDPNNPSSVASTQNASQPSSLGQTLLKGAGSLYNTLAAPIESIAAAPVQGIAKAIGAPDPYAQGFPSPFASSGAGNVPITPLSPEAKAGDVAQVGSYFIPGATLPRMAAMGALQGAGQAMSQEQSLPDVQQSGTTGALLGAGLGGASGLIGKAASYLPQRIARSFLPGTSKETAQYAVTKGLGTPSKMLEESDASLSKIGSELEQAVSGKGKTYIMPTGQEILSRIASQFPDSGLTEEEIAHELEGLVPLKRRLIDKMITGDITPSELHSLNSAIGKATYKTVFDTPKVKAGKTIGNAAYQTIGGLLKTEFPESAPLFDEYSKELQLNGALQKAIRSGEKARMLTLRDLVAFGSGLGLSGGNPLLGLAGVLAEKAMVNPSVNLKTAGVLSKLNTPAVGLAAKGSLAPLIKPLVTKNGAVKPQSQ